MAHVRRLWLEDFRSYPALDLELQPGCIIVTGPNGQGKSNLLEALGWLGSASSFRGAATDTLVRVGAERAILRAEVVRGDRELLIEVELRPGRPARIQVNRQRLSRHAELGALVPVTVFSPEDLDLVKGAPGSRRRFIDELLVGLHPRHDGLFRDLERILKQRNALLRQLAGRPARQDDAALTTLAVWDDRFVETGHAWAEARIEVLAQLAAPVRAAYRSLAGGGEPELSYLSGWHRDGLAAALAACRVDELRRGVSLTGPQRDDIGITLAGMPARTHASQGEQRSLALSLRMAAHQLRRDRHETLPLLLLDDVFSELDEDRARGLLAGLDADQTVITTTHGAPAGTHPELILQVRDSAIAQELPS